MKFLRLLPALIVLLSALNTTTSAQESDQQNDPRPVWQGITDTTAFNERMNAHIYRADMKIKRLKNHLKGQRLEDPIEDKAMQYLSAEQELENARLLARAAVNAHPEKSFRKLAQKWESNISEKIGQFYTDPEIYFYLTEIDSTEMSPEVQYIIGQKLDAFERHDVLLGKEERERTAAQSQDSTVNNKAITIVTAITVNSTILDEERKIFVHLPESYNNANTTRYPVLYLLDGETFFHHVTGIADFLSGVYRIPPMIIVGITNNDRMRDMTIPSKSSERVISQKQSIGPRFWDEIKLK